MDRLEDFYQKNKTKLNDKEKQYMQSRILTAYTLENLEKKALQDIGEGKAPKKAELEVNKGFLGLKDMKTEKQDTYNGCWSCAYSLMLKSRGIDLSQKEVRNYRAEFKEDGPQPGGEYLQRMNGDRGNSVYDNADLMMKVLPNTSMKHIDFNPMQRMYLRNAGATGQPLTTQEMSACEETYKKQVSNYITETVRKVLTEQQTPVVMNLGSSHYVTITGISEDGKTLRYEDSQTSLGERSTKYQSIDELVQDRLMDTPGKDVLKGLSFTWMQDINTPVYDAQKVSNGIQSFSLRDNVPDAAKADSQGNVTLSDAPAPEKLPQGDEVLKGDFFDEVPQYEAISAGDGLKHYGQLRGRELTQNLALDQNVLDMQIGQKIQNFADGKFFIATEHEYIPNKVYYKNDPQLTAENLFYDGSAELDEMDMLPLVQTTVTYRDYLNLQQQEYAKPGSDKPAIMAKVYALNKLRDDTKSGWESEVSLDLVTGLATIAKPAAQSLYARDDKTANMVNANDGQDLVTSIDFLAKPYSLGANDPNVNARKDAVRTAYDAMKASGTGTDWFGRTRAANSDEYNDFLTAVGAYNKVLEKGKVPTPLMTHMVVSQGLRYIGDKYTKRSTPSGEARFNHTMEVLRVTMPEQEYKKLLGDINRARKVEPGDKNYIGYDTYKPQSWKEPKAPEEPQNPQVQNAPQAGNA